MVRNQEKFDQAIQLRERGFTLDEIAKVCDVSKSTISKWLKNNVISEKVTKQNKRRAGQENAKRLQLMSKARASERATRYKEIKKSSETEFKHYLSSPLFVAGVALYSAHGSINDSKKVRFSTSDSQAHRIFVRFLIEYCGVKKSDIHCWLQLYANQTEAICMKQWSKRTSLPYQQFYRTQFVNSSSKKPLHYGVGNTIIGSTVLQRKLIHWVTLLHKTCK